SFFLSSFFIAIFSRIKCLLLYVTHRRGTGRCKRPTPIEGWDSHQFLGRQRKPTPKKRRYLLCARGLSKQEALTDVATIESEESGVSNRFDAFRYNANVQVGGEVDEAAYDRGVVGVSPQVRDEGPVD